MKKLVREGLRCILFLGLFLLLSHNLLAASPYFTTLNSGDILYAVQDQRFYQTTGGWDPDEEFPLNFTFGSDTGRLKSFWFGNFNSTHGVFDFKPNNSEVGSHKIWLILIDAGTPPEGSLIWVNVTVANVNDPPRITSYTPSTLSFEMYENNSVGFSFNYTATDPDIPYGDVLSNAYYLDGRLVSNSRSWTYVTDYCEPETHTVKLIVWDKEGLNDSIQWNITKVWNVNRRPTFNSSQPLPSLTWEEDTNLLNAFGLFPSPFYDPDYFCDERPDTLYFSAQGNRNISVYINPTTYMVSFYPNRDFFGVNNVTITLSDGHSSVSSNVFVLNVTPMPDNPRILPIPDQTVYAYVPFRYQVVASDPEGDPLEYFDNTPLFNINSTSGLIDFLPTLSSVGNHSITISVRDLENQWNSTTFKLEIKPNRPPAIDNIPWQQIRMDSKLSLLVTGSDPDGDLINYTIPYTGFKLVWQNATAARFNYTPYVNGTFNITVYAKDIHGATNSTWFMLNVSYLNLPPVIQPIPPQLAKIGKQYSYNVTAHDGNGGIETLTYYDNATFFDINPSTGRILFTPTPAQMGNYSVNITVCDNGDPPLCSSIVALYEIRYNRPPEITSNIVNATAYQGIPFALQITAIDGDNDPIVFSDNATIFDINPSTGWISFTPNASVSNRTYSINITVTDIEGAKDWLVFPLKIYPVNQPPYFSPPLNSLVDWGNMKQNTPYLIYINVTDPENDAITFKLNFSYIYRNFTDSKAEPFALKVISSKPGRALINFTPGQNDVGEYWFNITIKDVVNNTNSSLIKMKVHDVNDPPQLLRIYPYGRPLSLYTTFAWRNVSEFRAAPFRQNFTTINVSEGATILFNQSSKDIDPWDTMYYNWSVSGVRLGNSSSYSYYFDYDSPRLVRLRITVYDKARASDWFEWNISVKNVNRPPVFGMMSDYKAAHFSQGTFQRTALNAKGEVCLEKPGLNYYSSGNFTSRIIDLKARGMFNLTTLNFTGNVPSLTTLRFRVRTSPNNVSWTEWSRSFDPRLDPIPASNHRFVQYQMLMNTVDSTKSPCVSRVDINYKISDFKIKNNQVYASLLNLQDFFYDLDSDDVLTFGADSFAHMTVKIEDNYNVRIEPDGEYFGDDTLRFWAKDKNVTTFSNLIKVVIEQGTGSGSTSQVSSSSTRIVVQTQIQKEKEKEYSKFNLIAPEQVTVYKNESVLIPLRLTNPTNDTLLDIELSASSEIKGLNFTFGQKRFPELGGGESVNTSLWITPFKMVGTYEVLIMANVREPATNDTVKVMVNSREKGEHNASQIYSKIAFTADLLASTPECFELNEMLTLAVYAMQEGDFAKAESLVQKAVADCRYLASTKTEATEAPKPTGNFVSELMGNNTLLLSTILSFVLITALGLFLLYKKT